jgi:PleD family two-component response regulator
VKKSNEFPGKRLGKYFVNKHDRLNKWEGGGMVKILVAEDERDIRDLITFTLNFAGYEVIGAVNGEEAFEMALATKPDLILMDVRMPRMDGYDACLKMKAEESIKDIPVVFPVCKRSRGRGEDRSGSWS